MAAFNPQLISDISAAPLPPQGLEVGLDAPMPPAMPETPPPLPMPPPQPPKPVFVPIPMATPAPIVKKAMSVSPEVARKAQGIYPAEQQAKQKMIDNSKESLPTPTGAWGSPK